MALFGSLEDVEAVAKMAREFDLSRRIGVHISEDVVEVSTYPEL